MAVSEFILQRQAITQFVRDALQSTVDKQKENADKHGKEFCLVSLRKVIVYYCLQKVWELQQSST